MSPSDQALLRRSGLAFFGAIAASLSHELSNVFATINELSGLLEDLAAAAERGKSMDPSRIANVASRIAIQLQRGQRQTKQLNRFAHSTDCTTAEVDGRQIVEEMVALCDRFARLKKVELRSVVPGDVVPLETDPFLLRQLVWAGLSSALAVTEPGGSAEIRITAREGGARLEVGTNGSGGARQGGARQGGETAGEVGVLAVLARILGGQLLQEPASEAPFRVEVALPRRVTVAGDG